MMSPRWTPILNCNLSAFCFIAACHPIAQVTASTMLPNSASIHAADALVGRGRATDVDTVIVDGDVLLRDGRLVGIDREAIAKEIQATMGLPETADEIESRRRGRELVGHVNAFYAGWDLADGDPHYVLNQA